VGPQQISTIVLTCADTIRLATAAASAAADFAESLTRILSTVAKFPETGNPVRDAIIGELRASARGGGGGARCGKRPGLTVYKLRALLAPPPRAPACVRVCVPSRRTPALAPPGWGLLGRTSWTEAKMADLQTDGARVLSLWRNEGVSSVDTVLI
jgi:hypothetical protein